jgi:hypothetical protein
MSEVIKKILFLSANPRQTKQLRIDEELREIKEGLRRAREREQFIIESAEAVRYRDLRRAVLDSNPNIVHFSGHGAGEDGLVFEDESGGVKLVDADSLAGLFKLFADSVECVVLNACYSQVQSEAIFQHIPFVVGMGKAIGDRAAIEFAIAFYDAIGSGRDYEFAFEYARNAIDLAGIPESDTPKFLSKEILTTTSLIGEGGIDYTDLKNLLLARKWEEADQKTWLLLQKLVGHEDQEVFTEEEMRSLPCQDLQIIDQLWQEHSQGKFGFSKQKGIWISAGAQPNLKTVEILGDRVGWRQEQKWLKYPFINFSLSAPEGHLPLWRFGRRNYQLAYALMRRLADCRINCQEITGGETLNQLNPSSSTSVDRNQLLTLLKGLIPAQFNELIFRLNVPDEYLPGQNTPQAEKAIALLKWASAPGGIGLNGVQVALDAIINPR